MVKRWHSHLSFFEFAMNTAANTDCGPVAVRTALTVGGDPEIEALLRSILAPAEWVIEHAPNNAAALAMAHEKAFDLVLTDEKTSGADDIELLQKIRLVHPHTRLIILTDESTPSEVITAMREHAFSYFSRPYSRDALVRIIWNAITAPCWDDGIEIISATQESIRIAARCDLDTASRLSQFLDEIADLPNPERAAVSTAFREMLMNAIEHGGQWDPKKSVEISYVRTEHKVTCTITDPGEGFSFEEIPHAAISNPNENPAQHIVYRESHGMRPGGYGLLLARQHVDELIYSDKGNEVVLVKYLQN